MFAQKIEFFSKFTEEIEFFLEICFEKVVIFCEIAWKIDFF